jgi:nucleoside-diphosphate-sugar epimerase
MDEVSKGRVKSKLVAGAGGFIGGHLAKSLARQGHHVLAVDIKPLSDWHQALPYENITRRSWDLEGKDKCYQAVQGCDAVYNLACNMGGIGFIERNKALCMQSVLINTHLLMACRDLAVREYFYASSACVYNREKQQDANAPPLTESDAYPAMPDDGYGWEKLFSERMCRDFSEHYGIIARIARLHNVYGPYGAYEGGREKAPAALCRKVIEAEISGNHEIEIWGDGEQTRSFMYIDDCLAGIQKLMATHCTEPLNLGRNDPMSINDFVTLIEKIARIKLERKYDPTAPQGVRGRNSDNTKIKEVLNWEPRIDLKIGLPKTYAWIKRDITQKTHRSPLPLHAMAQKPLSAE